MLNNKGQSLVLFILIIPILLGVMALVIDVGNLINKKNEIDNIIEFVLDYGLDTIQKSQDLVSSPKELETSQNELEEQTNSEQSKTSLNEQQSVTKNEIHLQEELTKIFDYNQENNQTEIKIDEAIINIKSKTQIKSIFSKILQFNGFTIESEYKGYFDNGKKIIQKVK